MMPLPLDKLWCISGCDVPGMLSLAARSEVRTLSAIDASRRPRSNSATNIAVLDLVGPLSKYPSLISWLFGGTVMSDATSQIRAAAVDDRIAAIYLYVDSPGGTAAGVDELAQAIFEARQVKPVIAYVSDLAASGAYWAVSQATKIYANQAAFIGSIGVYTVLYDVSKLFEADGIRANVVKAGQYKAIGVPGAEITVDQLAEMQRTVDAIHRNFIAGVARGRMLPPDQVRGLADGRVHVASEAVRLGLIDAIDTGLERVMAPMKAQIEARRLAKIAAEQAAADAKAAEKRDEEARQYRLRSEGDLRRVF